MTHTIISFAFRDVIKWVVVPLLTNTYIRKKSVTVIFESQN